MKTTVDLPADLLRALKVRAVHEGRKLKDTVADTLRAGLAAPSRKPVDKPILVTRDKKTGIPVIQAIHPAAPEAEMTPERVAQVLAEQEARWAIDPR